MDMTFTASFSADQRLPLPNRSEMTVMRLAAHYSQARQLISRTWVGYLKTFMERCLVSTLPDSAPLHFRRFFEEKRVRKINLPPAYLINIRPRWPEATTEAQAVKETLIEQCEVASKP